MEQKKKVYTVEEVREILGIGKNKAYELCNNQTEPSRIGCIQELSYRQGL